MENNDERSREACVTHRPWMNCVCSETGGNGRALTKWASGVCVCRRAARALFVSAWVCDLRRVRWRRCASLQAWFGMASSAQLQHQLPLSHTESHPPTHTHTVADLPTRSLSHGQRYTKRLYTHTFCINLQLVLTASFWFAGFRANIVPLVWTAQERSVNTKCACASSVWALLVVIVRFSMHMCGQVWFRGGYEWLAAALTAGRGGQSCLTHELLQGLSALCVFSHKEAHRLNHQLLGFYYFPFWWDWEIICYLHRESCLYPELVCLPAHWT